MKRMLLSVVALLALMASSAFAQTPSPDASPVAPVAGIEGVYSQMFMAPPAMLEEPTDDALSVITMLVVMDSPDSAEDAFALMKEDTSMAPEQNWEEIDDLGDEAMGATYTEDSGEVISAVLVRDGELVVMSLVTASAEHPDIPLDVVKYVLETGKSDTEEVVNADGTVTGGWAEAFPQPGDVDGLDHFDEATVTKISEFED